ncbi:MAG TPA: cytochrome c [Blastocatellia bacterium]|nr:cytochrome c [Blastocatellia bacterium]
MKRFVYGGLTALVGASLVVMLVGILMIKIGLVPINADAAPSSLERKIFPLAVRASVARRSSEQADSAALPTDDDLVAGAEIYKEMCAQCHGHLNGRASVLGASFYPPAPQLPGHGTSYSDAEVFWIIKHGIRNTSMPSWRNLLSDENIRQVAAYIKRMDSLPAAVEVEADRNESRRGEANE